MVPPPFRLIICDPNATNTGDVDMHGKRKILDETYILTDFNAASTTDDVYIHRKKKIQSQTRNFVHDYGYNSPNFALREEDENHDPLTPLNTSIRKKIREDKNNEINLVTMIAFNNSIKETLLHKQIGEFEYSSKTEGIDELSHQNQIKLMNISRQNNINMRSADCDAMKCGNCFKQYKSKFWFLKHIRQQKCLEVKIDNKKSTGNDTAKSPIHQSASPSQSNSTMRKCEEAAPCKSISYGNLNIESESEEDDDDGEGEEEEDLVPEFINNFEETIKSMNSKTLEFKSAGDAEFQKFVKIVGSTTDAKYLDRKIARNKLKKIRSRAVKIGVYLACPLRVNDPVVHLDAAFWFVLTAMGNGDMSNALLEADREADSRPYKLIVSYMKAFMVNANAHCYAKSSMLSHVVLKDVDFRNNVLFDATCSDLLHWKSRTMDTEVRRKVRGTVEHMFREWTGERLETHLVCQQYEYLKRKGLVELTFHSPDRPSFACAKVPDVADPDFALLRSFCTTSYSAGYLDFLKQSLYCFALPFLEQVAETFVESGGMLNEAIVLCSVRRLNIAWFQNRNPLYELSDLYEHRGFDDVRASLRHIEDEQLNYPNKARGKNISF